VSRASSPIRNTAPSSNPRTSSSVMTLFDDSSRVTPLVCVSVSGTVLTNRAGVLSGAGPAFSSTSRTKARIRSRVSSIVVCQVKHAPSRTKQLACSKRKIDAPNVDAALADLKDQRLRAAGLCLLDWLFHEQMTVTAGDEIDAINLRRELLVVNRLARPSV